MPPGQQLDEVNGVELPFVETGKETVKIIYIAGGGHSGSTILSAILGTVPEIFNAGEVKFYNDHKNQHLKIWGYIQNKCTCGKNANECPYWQDVANRLEKEPAIFHYLGLKGRISTFLKILTPWHHIKRKTTSSDEYKLFKAMLESARREKPNATYIVDASKSVARLMRLCAEPGLEIKVVFVVKDGISFANSYRAAYKKGYFRWIVQWLVNNFLTLTFLVKQKIDYYHLSFPAFIDNPDKHFAEIGKLLGIAFPKNTLEMVPKTGFHIRAGNPGRFKIRDFSGLAPRDSQKPAVNKISGWLAAAFVYPFNRWWVYGPTKKT
jgi:hypothetical protein